MISPCEVLFKVQIFIDVFLNQLFNIEFLTNQKGVFRISVNFLPIRPTPQINAGQGVWSKKRGDKNKDMVVQRSETVTICFIIQIQSQFRTFKESCFRNGWMLTTSNIRTAPSSTSESWTGGKLKKQDPSSKKHRFFFNIMENVLVSQLGFPKNINYLEYLIFATSAGLKIVTFLLVRPKNLPDFIRGSHRPVGWQFHFFPPKTLLQCWVGNSLWLWDVFGQVSHEKIPALLSIESWMFNDGIRKMVYEIIPT